MILNYKITVMPFGYEATREDAKINTLTFKIQFTEDLDNFIRLWINNYPKSIINIKAYKNDSD